jgi:hypothetical protein
MNKPGHACQEAESEGLVSRLCKMSITVVPLESKTVEKKGRKQSEQREKLSY